MPDGLLCVPPLLPRTPTDIKMTSNLVKKMTSKTQQHLKCHRFPNASADLGEQTPGIITFPAFFFLLQLLTLGAAPITFIPDPFLNI